MIDIYNAPEKTVMVMCHTSMGDTIDQHGRYYEVGKEYKMTTSIVEPKEDTNNQECIASHSLHPQSILCWINHSEGYGSQFAVKGNVYRYDEPYWPDFKDYFFCPFARVRDEKLVEIGI